MVIWRTSYSSKLVTLSRLSVRAIQTSAGRNHAVTQRPSIAELLRPSNLPDGDSEHTLVVTGFVQSIRTQKRVAFAALSDGSSLEPVQVVMSPVHAERYVHGSMEAKNITLNSPVEGSAPVLLYLLPGTGSAVRQARSKATNFKLLM